MFNLDPTLFFVTEIIYLMRVIPKGQGAIFYFLFLSKYHGNTLETPEVTYIANECLPEEFLWWEEFFCSIVLYRVGWVTGSRGFFLRKEC